MLNMPKNPNKLLTDETITALKAIIFYKTQIEIITPIHAETWQEILKKHQIVITDRGYQHEKIGEIALNYNDLLLLPVNTVRILSHDVNKLLSNEGFKTDNIDYCPLLVAKNNLMEAETFLINSLEQFTGISSDNLIKINNRNKYIELNLHLLIPIATEKGINLNILD